MWQLYSILAGLFLASADAFSKQILEKENAYYIVWIRLLFSAFPLLIVALWTPIPDVLPPRFWLIITLLAPLEILAIVLYVKALKLSPISLCIPFLAFTPVFLLVISFFLLGELPTPLGLLGVMLIVTGGYIVSADGASASLTAPLHAIKREMGVKLMLTVAFLFSITSSLAKIAIEYSGPSFFAVFYYILLVPLFLPIVLIKHKGSLVKSISLFHVLTGFCLALMVYFHSMAISMTKVVYMIALKRSSLIFSILFGYIFFQEKKIAHRLTGGLIMLCGVFLINMA